MHGLLCRAGRGAHALDAGAGPLQGLYLRAEAEHVSVAAHDGRWRKRHDPSRCRFEPMRCTASRNTALRRTGATRKASRSTDSLDNKLYWLRQILDWQNDTRDSERVHANRSRSICLADEVFVFTPKGEVIDPAEGRNASRLCVSHPLARSAISASARRSTAASCRWIRRWNTGDFVEVITSAEQSKGP